MKKIITSTEAYFDNTAYTQLAEILREQGFKVKTESVSNYGKSFERISSINDCLVLFEGRYGKILKFSALGVSGRYKTYVRILLNKNINIAKLIENTNRVIKEYGDSNAKELRNIKRVAVYRKMVEFDETLITEEFQLRDSIHSFRDHGVFSIRERSEKHDYQVKEFRVSSDFKISTIPAYTSRDSSIPFTAINDAIAYYTEMQTLVTKIQPYLDKLKQFVESLD